MPVIEVLLNPLSHFIIGNGNETANVARIIVHNSTVNFKDVHEIALRCVLEMLSKRRATDNPHYRSGRDQRAVVLHSTGYRSACLPLDHARSTPQTVRSSRAGIRQNAASAAGFRLRLGGGTFRIGCVALSSSLHLHSISPLMSQTEALCLNLGVELNGNCAPVYARSVKLQTPSSVTAERSRLKHPAPNPEIVTVLPNGDLGYINATRKQHADFVAWRSHACRHPEGVVTRVVSLAKIILKYCIARCPHKRAFPLFVQKMLGCKPHTPIRI